MECLNENDVLCNIASSEPEKDVQVTTEPEKDDPEATSMVDGVLTLKLYRPLAVNGKTLVCIRFDFGGLCESDLADIEREVIEAKEPVMKNLAYSTSYCRYIAARASGINQNDLKRLSAKDAYKIATEVQAFFMV
jgi:hypothetical protein